jgi:hypothetical protein
MDCGGMILFEAEFGAQVFMIVDAVGSGLLDGM